MLKCQSVERENKDYIDPGLFIFKGASATQETKTVLPTVQEIVETVQSDKNRTWSDQDQMQSDQEQPLLKMPRISLEEYRDRSTAKKERLGTSMATQTSWKDCVSLPCQTPEKNYKAVWRGFVKVWINLAGQGRSRRGELHREREARRLLEKRNREHTREGTTDAEGEGRPFS